jgi:glycosyltransferase involved in cell wall biosynthesis
MLVSIGILAHNEANEIGSLISDIADQSLLLDESISFEIHVVANGCTDLTQQVAEDSLAARQFERKNINTFVHNITRAGKSNAWNELVHFLASPKTDFIFLLDADIRLAGKANLQRILYKLIESPSAFVAIDESVSDLSEKANKSIVERLILAASATAYDTRTAICGQLYCANFDVLRRIWMPIGLPAEDGFLRAMILTSNFTEDEQLDRMIFVEGAQHIFESERRIRKVFRHNVRITIGVAINVLLFNHFRELRKTKQELGSYIRTRNAADPDWVNDLIAEACLRKKYFLLRADFIFRRLVRFSSLTASEKMRKLPIFVLGFVFDITLSLSANYLMRKGAGAGFW